VGYIVGALERQTGVSPLKVYAASSTRALMAKLAGDNEAYRQSGLGSLEEAISPFLAAEKSSTFLVAILDKAAAIASRELAEPDAVRRASARQEIAEIQQLIGSLRDTILRHDSAGLRVLGQTPVVVPSASPRPKAESIPTASEQPDVRSELGEPGCPVCNHLMEAVFEFYREFQYRLSADEPT
jgi:hypothetical protein